jgi:gamma-glutamyltranspeptidase/glutathione hydrolase
LASTELAGRRRAAAASEHHVAEAARDVLARGNAVDAVVAGVLMAAAESPGVLLGPVQLLAGGAGAGLIAIDGRVRQPGLGAPRPRGFLAAEAVPDAARIGVPLLPASLATAVASLGAGTLLRAAGPALARAKARSPERAGVLEAVARRGAPALAEERVAAELLAAAGRVARGLLTPEDLSEAMPALTRCEERALGPSGILTVPWREAADGSFVHVVAAADGKGRVAIACYEVPDEGIQVAALGLVAPRAAEPVLRGKPRVTPGSARPAGAPIALRARKGVVELALGIAAAANANAVLDAVVHLFATAPTFAEALAAPHSGRAVALSSTRDEARVLASA